MKKRFSSLAKQAAVIALSITVFSGVGYVFAQPTVAPNGSAGVALPLHSGVDAQTKSGPLTVNGTLTASGALNVGGALSAPTICLNGACNSTWPGGGALQAASGANVGNWASTTQGGSYNSCEIFHVYHSNGDVYSSYNTCGPYVPISVQISAPGQVIWTSEEYLRCVWTYGQYSSYDAAFALSENSYGEPYYTDAFDVSFSVNGNVITLTGNCPPNYNWNYIRPVASVRYLYQ